MTIKELEKQQKIAGTYDGNKDDGLNLALIQLGLEIALQLARLNDQIEKLRMNG
jgi:hypothetical protein